MGSCASRGNSHKKDDFTDLSHASPMTQLNQDPDDQFTTPSENISHPPTPPSPTLKPSQKSSEGFSFSRSEKNRSKKERKYSVTHNDFDKLLSELRFKPNNLKMTEEPMAQCSTGLIYRGTYENTQIVQKLFDPRYENTRCFQSECRFLLRLQGPNIIPVVGLSSRPPFIVFPFYPRGTLANVLYGSEAIRLPWSVKHKFMLDICRGLTTIHQSRNRLHGAINSHHILVSDDNTLVIAGFGTELRLKMLSTGDERSDEPLRLRSIVWSPPEILGSAGRIGWATDIYGFGIVMWEIIMQQEPFLGHDSRALVADIVQQQLRPHLPDVLPNGVPNEMISLIRDCWQQDPTLRIPVAVVMERLLAIPAT
ncbi:putative serine/threonine protein kinase [Blattamonas nauphoetae]|uniref:Serine/threonine protein kinase n=1 Tax=Blattamonas nauphoetae TaxID=2049346 RepID=A0ABQ9XQJ6_9EUKA|nr:putative serine/threonine protein kinase [Blattamonas nauphoetae]